MSGSGVSGWTASGQWFDGDNRVEAAAQRCEVSKETSSGRSRVNSLKQIN